MFLIGIVSATLIMADNVSPTDKTVYVGVTYEGDTVDGAKQLIDKVKTYTNLFILSSGELNFTEVEEIGDYTIAAGLNFSVYIGTNAGNAVTQEWLDRIPQRWDNHFIGIYFYDEPGGKMLDDRVWFTEPNRSVAKEADGSISIGEWIKDSRQSYYYPNSTIKVTTIAPDKTKNGTLHISHPDHSYEIIQNIPCPEELYIEYPNGTTVRFEYDYRYRIESEVMYYPNDDITVLDKIGEWDNQEYTFYTMTNGSARITEVEPRSVVLDRNPFNTCDGTAQAFEAEYARRMQFLENVSVPLFTADYALHWWDFRGGYDMVLAELGWNNTIEQEIGLVRGAANLQGKSWGTIITWKYTQRPFLADGQEIFEQMKTSYETGAEYIIVFNYSEDPTNPNTLEDEHYQALERFWTEVVQNPDVTHGSIKAEAALVLPKNFGWGMRNPQDTIWGLWPANDTCQQIWNQVHTQLDKYGLKLDIVYDDPDYPVANRYSNIYYVNAPFPYMWLIAAILLLPITAGILLIYFKRRKNQTTKPVTL
ncbi:hypothetical protein [Candidatus Bathycorpusculum sp.]|uniref:hypothetical protein n=1 Tax=Candidatus Bathycorpusculum sp. TaxID=2994959 RepID=UPI00282A9A25|nr:hypothetical protein [Candidatus Termitimicrobium sp.]MCL2685077.1 hypothetical protein [Candidatus Termitimicrobium sp.]